MVWNWQLSSWPNFTYNLTLLESLEREFLQGAGGVFAIWKSFASEEKKQFIVEVLSTEGVTSSKIEGEILERDSLQSSLRKHFRLKVDEKRATQKEAAMASLLCKVHETYSSPLTHEMLHDWHHVLMDGSDYLEDVGRYRSHPEPMQIVSGRYDDSKVYFEAPPSSSLEEEMTGFINWFNDRENAPFVLVKAAITHVYFESIHPFIDGNGRLGRALVEKVISQYLGHPSLISVSMQIEKRRKEYYAALGSCNRNLDISRWISFFAEVLLQAQKESEQLLSFLLAKSRIMNSLIGKINHRQEKVLLRVFSEGTKGFAGGLSAENYISITKTSRASATRDLVDLVKKGVLSKTGERKSTRYWLILN
ncbi:Uncharacterized protein SCG7109_AQ_00040 [Chlamydiales bacterium SCGC AG-110-M15]|nr:Uncharacterized protein SCG7109_AQ_00040 [Chlamydiales bacterium SCGC AG-110-M15]